MGHKDDHRRGSAAKAALAELNVHRKVADLEVIYSGWVLKKKKKKMQGYAKRYLVLTSDGILTYTISPEKPTRDSIEVPHASVTSSKRHGTIHVDSGSSVFHLKMLNLEDFESWRKHLRSFIPERSTGNPQQIYIHSGSEMVPVEVDEIFTSLDATDKHVRALSKSLTDLDSKASQKSTTDAILGAFGAKSAGSSDDMSQLSALSQQLQDEFARLKHAIEARIPRTDGQDGFMNSIRSSKGIVGGAGAMSKSRISVSSLATTGTDSAIFYDADEQYNLDDDLNRQDSDLTRSESSENYDDESEDSGPESETSRDASHSSSPKAVQFRTRLPAKVSGDEVSLFSMLKKNVGKDLATISFPVSFNCPLSLLQAAAEEYEYAPDLLERAAKSEDWIERICLVGAFAVSSYASTKLRASRKPFNPLLGETFECVREDKRFKFVAEKVVHQPPIVASYAEGKGWKCQGWSAVKNKFWGKSLELIPEGQLRLEFGDGDVFTFVKPSSFMRNLLAGNKYLEHVGELTVTNENTGQRIVLEFKEGTMWGGASSRNNVSGTVYDANDKAVTSVRGKWSESFARQQNSDTYQVLWEAAEMPPYAEEYYGFTYFAMSLNEITPDCEKLLPPTDSRLRPDQRAFEEGNVDKAEELKHKLEEAQRSRRRKLESEGQSYTPRWFSKHGDHPEWQYGGPSGADYFKTRKTAAEAGKDKAWTDVPDVFNV